MSNIQKRMVQDMGWKRSIDVSGMKKMKIRGKKGGWEWEKLAR